MNRTFALLTLAVLATGPNLLQAALPKQAPEIFSLNPDQGPSGQEIELKGSGLEGTRHVYFCVGHRIREAKFTVVSAKELKVIAPPFLGSGAAATVVVETVNGVTVGMPPSALKVDQIANHSGNPNTFCHVVKNGVLTSSSGSVFVEEGGAADAPMSGGLCFVKNGGSLLKLHSFRGMIFHEPMAQSQPDPAKNRPHHSVRVIVANEITTSVGIDQFLYERPKEPEEPAKSAPKVTSAGPNPVRNGSLITLKGSGFLETSKVHVISEMPCVTTADYRVVSDNQLEIDMPDSVFGIPMLLIVNPKGATLVMWHGQITNDRRNFQPRVTTVQVVGRGTVISNGSGSCNYLIEKGGIVAHTGGSCNFFVLDGGRMSLNSGSGGLNVFCENAENVEQGNGKGGGGHNVNEVGPLSVSLIPTPIEIPVQ